MIGLIGTLLKGRSFLFGVKHSKHITLILLALFIVAQYLGIAILYSYVDPVQTTATGQMTFRDAPFVERPELEEDTSYIPIMISIIVGTVIVLILMRFRLHAVWKGWFLLSIVISLTVAFGAFVPAIVALVLAVGLGVWKIFRPNFWVHNGTEIFMYGGLASIFVPVLNLFSVSILMVLIGVYDAYAVWKSKHMITLAKETTKARVFAGLFVPYGKDGFKKVDEKKVEKVESSSKVHKDLKPHTSTSAHSTSAHIQPPQPRTAILGGGDIAFPLLFAGVVFKEIGLWQSLIIPLFALAGLGLLLWYGKQDRFYPAMPFIGAGCFVGLGVVWLIGLLL